MVKYVTKSMYNIEKENYMAWRNIIKFITFGKVDVIDTVQELLDEMVIINVK